MTVNSRKVFDFLKANGVGVKFSIKDIQTALDFDTPAKVMGSIRGFYKKGYVNRGTEIRTINGEAKETPIYWLVEKGAMFDPDTEE